MHLVEKSQKILSRHGYGKNRFKAIVGDCTEIIEELEPNRFDIILCLGFFYHTLHHFQLLAQFRRLNPRLVILDTRLSTLAAPAIVLSIEDSSFDGYAIRSLDNKRGALVGKPTKAGLGMMLEHVGFAGKMVDWNALDLTNWDGCEEYQKGERFTILLKPKERGAAGHP